MSSSSTKQTDLPTASPCVLPVTASDSSRWFTEEVHPHGGRLKSWLRSHFPGVRDVDDIVQESYLRIWKARATKEIQSAKAFLFLIARHLALDQVRRQHASPIDLAADFSDQTVLSSETHAADLLVTQELFECLGHALIALPDHYREVIILHKLQGLSQKEVAVRLNLSPRSVEKYVMRALVRIGSYLREHNVHGTSR